MKYIHIFDYFNEDGKYSEGCELVTDTTQKPTGIRHGVYRIPDHVVYVGWCYEEEKVSSGCYFPDAVTYDRNTKKLTPIIEKTEPFLIYKLSKFSPYDMTLEKCCEIKGIDLPEDYVKSKEMKERKFQEEYQKCVSDIEYFRKNYYNEKDRNRNSRRLRV